MKYLIVVIAITLTGALEIFDRPCRSRDELQVKINFQPAIFTGTWFEHERYESANQTGLDCVVVQYTANLNPDLTLRDITVDNRGKNLQTGGNFQDLGVAVLSFPDEVPLRAQLNVTFAPGQESRSNYWVLRTDYSNYAVVHSCRNIENNRSSEVYWLIKRSLTLTPESRRSADEVIEQFLERERIRPTEQDNIKCGRI